MTYYKYLPDFAERLSIKNLDYATYLDSLKNLYILSDKLGNYSFLPNTDAKAEVLLKSDLVVLSGIEEIQYLFADIFEFEFKVNDGDLVESGSVFRVSGKLHDILNWERFMLDLIARMTQVSTCTNMYAVPMSKYDIKPAATRKSLTNPILKKAVSLGGGVTHRLNLEHALIVKDNFKILNFSELLLNFSANLDFRNLDFVEFEVESEVEIYTLMKYLKSESLPISVGIMLDNFAPKIIPRALDLLRDSNLFNFVEVSGGINLQNMHEFMHEGVDIISTSQLFNTGAYPDFSLELLK